METLFLQSPAPGTWTISALEGETLIWQETCAQTQLSDLLKRLTGQGRLDRKTKLVCLLPEALLTRRLVRLPQDLKPTQRRKQALALLATAMRAPCGAWRLEAWDHAPLVSAVGARKSDLDPLRKALGPWEARADFVDGTALALPQAPRDGCLSLALETGACVLTLRDGAITDGRYDPEGAAPALYQTLCTDQAGLGLETGPLLYGLARQTPRLDQENLQRAALKKTGSVSTGLNKRLTLALVLACLVLPLAAAAALETFQAPAPQTAETSQTGPRQTAYSRLADLAAQAQTDRVAIHSQQARSGSLIITGTCPDMLDLADYMVRLEEADPTCHPLLQEATHISAEDGQMCYNFILQISQPSEGGDPA